MLISNEINGYLKKKLLLFQVAEAPLKREMFYQISKVRNVEGKLFSISRLDKNNTNQKQVGF